MTRLPLVPVPAPDPVTAEVFERSVAEGREPIALYRVLANNPLLLRSYAELARGLRYDAQTPRALRELAILRIAQLCRSEYEWQHHRTMAQAAGVPEDKVAALTDWRSSGLYDETERAVLACVEEQHELAVSEATVTELRRLLGDAGSVEIVLLCGLYEAVARLLQAFDIDVEDGVAVHAPVTA
jgi:alkylhydroperoxidase family enzyme